MKRLSLKWRLTLMTALLVTVVCLILNFLISHSAIMRIDDIENYMVEISPTGQESFSIGIDSLDFFPGLEEKLQQSKDTFRIQSIITTLIVILLSSTITYFFAGRVLSPLRKFSSHMENIQAQNLNEPLEVPAANDEIAQLTNSYNEMIKRLNQAFTVQRQFSANAAHELRTPLAVMQTNLDVLQKRKAPTLTEYAEAVKMAAEQTGRLSHLVDILLEMTELQTVKRNDRISLSALIEEVICDLTQIADDRSVTLIQEEGEAVLMGSDTLLYRAIYNLVENAIKYNRANGTVTVGVTKENNLAVINVTDTGIGISKENREEIFEPFVRVDKTHSRSMGGCGLGLALVRDIALQHGGSVRVAESSDTGTVILLTLPVSE